RNRWSRVGRITGNNGKSADGETVADRPAVARKRGNARRAKGPSCSQCLWQHGRQGAMIKALSHLQDLSQGAIGQGEEGSGERTWSRGVDPTPDLKAAPPAYVS